MVKICAHVMGAWVGIDATLQCLDPASLHVRLLVAGHHGCCICTLQAKGHWATVLGHGPRIWQLQVELKAMLECSGG